MTKQYTQEEIEDIQARAYCDGSRMTANLLLINCINQLGYMDVGEKQCAKLISEREFAIKTLKDLCETFGDNMWNPHMKLSDIIENHLKKYLEKNNSILIHYKDLLEKIKKELEK